MHQTSAEVSVPYYLFDKASWDLVRALSGRANSDTAPQLSVHSDGLPPIGPNLPVKI